MKRLSFVLTLFLLTLCASVCLCQGIKSPSSIVLFETFSVFENASLIDNNANLALGNQGQLGAFSEIKTYYALGSMSFDAKESQAIALSFYSYQEGLLIAENRLKLGYRKKIVLNPQWNLSAGGQLGFINTAYKATRSTAGTSAFTPIFDFGFTLRNEVTSISASVNQLNNPEAYPLTQKLYFNRYYTALISHGIQLNSLLLLRMYLHYRYISDLGASFTAKGNLEFRETYLLGLGVGSNGFIISCGLKEISKNFPISIHLAYQTPLGQKQITKPFQVHLSYFFKG